MGDQTMRQAKMVLGPLGRGFGIAGMRAERWFVEHHLGASYRVDRTQRYVGGYWLNYDAGFRFAVVGVGTLYVPADCCVLESDRTAEIQISTVFDRDREAVKRAMGRGLYFDSDGGGPDPLRNAIGLEMTEPEQIRAIVLDLRQSVLKTDPSGGVEIELKSTPGPDGLPCDEEEIVDFVRWLVFRSLGIRENVPVES